MGHLQWFSLSKTYSAVDGRGRGGTSCRWRSVTKSGWTCSQGHVEGVPTPCREGWKVLSNSRGSLSLWQLNGGAGWEEGLGAKEVAGGEVGELEPLKVFTASQSPIPPAPNPLLTGQKGTYQDVQAGGLQQGDLVCDSQAGEAWQAFSKLHDLDNALGGQFAEFVPEAQVQPDSMVSAGILRGREDTTVAGEPCGR